MKSLRNQLLFFWFLLATVCAALGFVMWALFRASAGAQIDAAREGAQVSCTAIATRYGKSLPQAPSPPEGRADAPRLDLLQVVLHLVLIEAPHIEGGVWSRSGGFLAYAYPTYEGSGVKRDVPPAEQDHIASLAGQAAQAQSLQTDVVRASREALIVSACPLASADHDLVAWTMTRTPTSTLDAQAGLRIGLGVLLGFVLVSGVWLGILLTRGYRHAAQVERQQARDQRLTALGRMVGGIAHEIRNPIAAMRLKAENALAGPSEQHPRALAAMIGQIDRLNGLVQNLLAIVQPMNLDLQPLQGDHWLETRLSAARPAAHARGIELMLRAQAVTLRADALHLGRAVDNLLDNAIRHARHTVCVTLERSGDRAVTIRVSDDGPGIAAALRAHLFEPFASGRREGTGLGLALAREVVIAHGGDLRFVEQPAGACFEIDLPWQAS